ncbi:CDP-alcohol phosphatidyltransferase family protein [Clostridiaceae bacterium M8S5]|nr:CDP-alcohol phosphatidyltransferase family protein [Clostridiaceae bacterium M8S5]
MLDTHGRRFVDPLLNKFACIFLRLRFKPNHITIIALIIGMASGIFIYFDRLLLGCIFLWVSGLCDAVDGAMARISKTSSPWGTLIDIVFDRIVEASVILGLASKISNVFPFLLLTISILLSMTIFLTVGTLSDKQSKKSFYYQAGLAERTEGFIMFTLMIFLRSYINEIAYIFTVFVLFTALQRIIEAKKILS